MLLDDPPPPPKVIYDTNILFKEAGAIGERVKECDLYQVKECKTLYI